MTNTYQNKLYEVSKKIIVCSVIRITFYRLDLLWFTEVRSEDQNGENSSNTYE